MEAYTIAAASTLRDAWISLNASGAGICLVVDEDGRLLDTITDGDIRRAILDAVSIDSPVSVVAQRKQLLAKASPIVAGPEMSDAQILNLMKENKILNVPVLDADGKVLGLKLMRDLVPPLGPKLDAMVMAGGYGKRLMPLTEQVPKPMLQVGGKPILEHIVGQLKTANVQRVIISTHYLSEMIHDHFGDGSAFGVCIDYVDETSPMGTAGALGFVENVERPLLVINGDIMTEVDFRSMLAFHDEQGADITVGVARYQFQVPYGVIECEGTRIAQITEKPQVSFFINGGIYLLSPRVVKHVERGQRLDMPELIQRVVDEGGSVAGFPIVEYWLDIGGHSEFEKAKHDHETA